MSFHFRFLSLLVGLGLLFLGFARAQVTTATFYGIVTDPSGGAVPAARVTIVNEGTGATAAKTTDAAGEFVFDFLSRGLYTLRIEVQGFKKFESKGMELLAAQNIRRSFALELGAVTETVTVTGAATLVSTASTEQLESRSQLEVTQLPVARRNYSSLLAIGTGVSYTTADGNGVRLNGVGKSGTNITVDGTDASANPEGRLTSMYQGFNYIDTMSIEAIQEVQVIKGVIQAEYGQALSGHVNLISRSGTNTWHGSVFENFEAENLAARNPFLTTKPPVTFNQFGGSIGGPIRRDRIFVFGTYEGYRERRFQQVQGNTPTQKLRDEMIRAVPAYKRALDTLPLPNQPHEPDADVGFFRGASASQASDNHGVVKGDIRITDTSNLSLTYTRGRPFRLVPRFHIKNDRDWKGWQERGTISYVRGGANWSSETRYGYNLNDMNRLDEFFVGGLFPDFPEDTFGGRRYPSISALGFGTAGTEIIQLGGPTWTLEHKYARHLGQHSLKFGGKYSRRGGGRFDIENDGVRYENKAELLANIPSRITATIGVNPYESRSYELGFFAQDDWRVSPRLVVNFGLRYDFFSKFVAEPTTQAPAGLYNLDGLRDDKFTFGPLRNPKDPFENDAGINLSPRLGFSYNPDGQGTNVIRGGFAVMFSPLIWGTFNNAVGNTPFVPFRRTFSKAEAAELRLKFPVFNDDVRPILEAQQKVNLPDIFKPTIQAPYTMNLYLGVQRALTSSTMFETAFVGNRGVKFFMYRRFNRPDRLTGVRPNPDLGEGNYLDDSQNTVYTSWQTSLRKRYTKGLTGSVHYTWGKAISYTGGDIGATFQGDAESPVQDFFNWRAERGPSAGEITHYFVSDWVYDLPGLSNAGNAAVKQVLGGWQVSGIFRAQSGGAFNLDEPCSSGPCRPDYVGGNPIRSDYRNTLVYLNTAAFAAVPKNPRSGMTVQPGNLGRRALRGPGSWGLNFALGKNFSITEQVKLQFRADLFNAFNNVNLGGPDGNIESRNFGRILGAGAARVMQLNARLNF